jgi:hypothetical protein
VYWSGPLNDQITATASAGVEMIELGRLRDWILPELIYLDPTVATAYHRAVAEDEATRANARRLASVSDAPRVSTA